MPNPQEICTHINKSAFDVTFHSNFVFHDANGVIVCAFVKNALPPHVAKISTKLLAPAAKLSDRDTHLNGGVKPRRGIAGYYDYFGTQVEKCRKTAFTMASLKKWTDVFPLVEYTNAFYKELCPNSWSRQEAAIPDNVRIRKTVFSTLTVNANFRAAKHKDNGDFTHGLGALSVLHGDFHGICLGFPDFGFCVDIQPRDLVFFDTHHFHCNTELERPEAVPWSRLSCVSYFRTKLASQNCLDIYKEKMGENTKNLSFVPKETYSDETAEKTPSAKFLTPASPLIAFAQMKSQNDTERSHFTRLEEWFVLNSAHFAQIPHIAPRPSAHFKASTLRSLHFHTHGLSAHEAFQSSTDYLHNLDLLGVPDDIQAAWRIQKLQWVEEIKKAYRITHNGLTWRKTGDLAVYFAMLCDTAKKIFLFIMSGEKISEMHKANFNALLAAHLLRAHNAVTKHRFLTLEKLKTKLLDHELGDPQNPKDGGAKWPKYDNPFVLETSENEKPYVPWKRLRQHNGQFATEVNADENAEDAGTDTEEEKNTEHPGGSCYDFQTEDVEVDYAKLGLQHPADFVKERLKGVQSIETLSKPKDCESSLRILLLEDTQGQIVDMTGTPKTTDVYSHDRSLVHSQRIMLKEAYERLRTAFVEQSQHAPTTWNEMDGIDIQRKDVCDVFLETFDASGTDVIFAPSALRARSTDDQRHILQILASFQIPIIFKVHLAEDPQHFLLRPEHQKAHTRVANDFFKDVTGHSGSNLLTAAEWREQLDTTGWETVGTYSVRGAALADMYCVAVPKR